jgi:hypothetical protein
LFPSGAAPETFKERWPLVETVDWDRFKPELGAWYEVNWV